MIDLSLSINSRSSTSTPVLNLITASVNRAYSLRKLKADYTGAALRVRRSSDSTEQDIGFDLHGDLDVTAMLEFVGSGNGFVRTWYDQSGNANHANMSTAASQLQIVNTGVYSGALVNPNSNSFLTVTGFPTSWFASIVGAPLAGGTFRTLLFTSANNYPLLLNASTQSCGAFDVAFRSGGFTWNNSETAVVSMDATTTTVPFIKNNGSPTNVSFTSISRTLTQISCGGSGQHWGRVQELVFLAASPTEVERQILARNQGAYFGVTVS